MMFSPRAAALLSGLVVLVSACTNFDVAQLSAAESVVDQAEVLEKRGDRAGALRLVRAELDKVAQDTRQAGVLSRAMGRLHQSEHDAVIASGVVDPVARDRALLQSERAYRAALSADPNDLEAAGGLAIVLSLQGKDEESKALASRVHDSDAHVARYRLLLATARIHERAGRYDAAIASLREAVEVSQRKGEASQRIVDLVRSGRASVSVEDLAGVLVKNGDPEGALSLYEWWLDRYAGDPDRPWAKYLDLWAKVAAQRSIPETRLDRVRHPDRGSRYETAVRELSRAFREPKAVELAELVHWVGDRQPTIRAVLQREAPQPVRENRLEPRFVDIVRPWYSGIYVGGSWGFTDGGNSAGEMQRRINRRTPDGRDVTVQLDDTDDGYKVFFGYPLGNKFAVELGYTDIDGQESQVDTTNVDANLASDVLELHPVTGHGPSLSLLGVPLEVGPVSMFAKLGLWYWESDVEVSLGNSLLKKDGSGWDLIAGLGAQVHLIEGLNFRAEYERYFIDDFDIDMVSLGFVYRF